MTTTKFLLQERAQDFKLLSLVVVRRNSKPCYKTCTRSQTSKFCSCEKEHYLCSL